MPRKKNKNALSWDLPAADRAAIDALVADSDLNKLADTLAQVPIDKTLENQMLSSKDSYAFWGPTAAELVPTPETLYIPLSFEAFRVSGMHEFNLTSPWARMGAMQVATAAAAIAKWTEERNLDSLFLKNSVFSAKHRWPFTCNVDFSMTPDMTLEDKVHKIVAHICNINSTAMLQFSEPGLGLVARRKLDLKPMFYAFGTMLHRIIDPDTGHVRIFESNAMTKNQRAFEKLLHEPPRLRHETFHIGMPITKEARAFGIHGRVVGYAPYWTPRAFENQIVYGLREGQTVWDAVGKMNTFSPEDIAHIHTQTEKILKHPKFADTNWAIDWIVTRDNQWYMTDMQTAENSYMDYANMVFVDETARKTVNDFVRRQRDTFAASLRHMSPMGKFILSLTGHLTSLNEILKRYGYPTDKELTKICASAANQKKR